MAQAHSCASVAIIGGFGVGVVTAETATAITISCVNLAGVATDFQVSFVLHGGGNVV